jgi:hypothetical protein
MKNFYVYGHYDQENNLRYVGKGKANRAYSFYQRSLLWNECFADDEPIVKILKDNLTEEESFAEEIYFINLAIQNGDKLLNICSGGSSENSSVWTKEARDYLSSIRKGKLCYWYGRKRDKSVIDAMNNAKPKIGYWAGKKRDPELIKKLSLAAHTPEALEKAASKRRGRKLSPEWCAKISAGNKGKLLGRKFSQERIEKMKLIGIGKSWGNHTEETKAILSQKATGRKASEETKAILRIALKGRKTSKAKQVLCVELNKTFRCALEASKETGACYKKIQSCCTGKRNKTGGYQWKYV